MIDFSDDEYFEEVDSDYQVNEREQGSEVDTWHDIKLNSLLAYIGL